MQPPAAVWTPEEDDKLEVLVAKHGTTKWSVIAQELNSKHAKQCRRRWRHFVNAGLRKGGWTYEEDLTLVQGHKQFGNKWTEIAKAVGGRTDNATKNRWMALCKKNKQLERDHILREHTSEPCKRGRKPSRLKVSSKAVLMVDSPVLIQTAAPGMNTPAGFSHMPSRSPARPPQYQGLCITIPEAVPPAQAQARLFGNGGADSDRASGLLSIRVYKDMLTPQEMQLATDVNNNPEALVQIQLEDAPLSTAMCPSWISAPWTESSPNFEDLLKFVHTGFTPKPTGAMPSRNNRVGITPGSTASLNLGHRQLLHKLLTKGRDTLASTTSSPRQENAGFSSHSRKTGGALAEASNQAVHIGSSSSYRPVVTTGVFKLDSPRFDVVVSPVFTEDELNLLCEALCMPEAGNLPASDMGKMDEYDMRFGLEPGIPRKRMRLSTDA